MRPEPFHRAKNKAAMIRLMTDDASGKRMYGLMEVLLFLRISNAAEMIMIKTIKLIRNGIFPFPAANIKTGISEKKRPICFSYFLIFVIRTFFNIISLIVCCARALVTEPNLPYYHSLMFDILLLP